MNPCINCLVNSMCKDPCNEMQAYLKKNLDLINPKNAIVYNRTFLQRFCTTIKKQPNRDRLLVLEFDGDDNRNLICEVIIENGIIQNVRCQHDSKTKPV